MKPCQLDRLNQWRAITIVERIAADRRLFVKRVFDWSVDETIYVQARHDAVIAVAKEFPKKPSEWLASVFLCHDSTIRAVFAKRRYHHPGIRPYQQQSRRFPFAALPPLDMPQWAGP